MSRVTVRIVQLCASFFLALALTLIVGPAAAQQTPQSVAEPPPVPAANPQKTQDELQAAYQKEYAFLEAQLRELQARLAEFEREAQQGVREKEAEIDRAEGAFIELQSRGERINDLLIEAEREIGTIEDSRATLEALAGGAYRLLRINFANGDMVGHTGDLQAAIQAVEAVDLCLGRLLQSVGDDLLEGLGCGHAGLVVGQFRLRIEIHHAVVIGVCTGGGRAARQRIEDHATTPATCQSIRIQQSPGGNLVARITIGAACSQSRNPCRQI